MLYRLAATCILTLACVTFARAEDPVPALKVLIVDGQNNHDFALMSPFLAEWLEGTGRYEVEISTSPAAEATAEEWAAWQPAFEEYDVVLSNYNGEDWPAGVKADFDAFVRHGGGVLVLHGANNCFAGWDAFDEMIGLGWREADYGARLYYDENDELIREAAGEGIGAGCAGEHAFVVETRDAENPIMAGLPAEWLHAQDELYHGQRGPAENMHILASAYSDPAHGGTGEHELMMWWVPYGEGKVLTNVMGHVWTNQTERPALRCVGFLTVLDRSCEWLATGEVTTEPPANFPGQEEVVLIENLPTE